MKITIVTDSWTPLINGVTTTLTSTVKNLEKMGHIIQVINPTMFKTIPMPKYPEIPLSWDIWKVGKMIDDFGPHAIHIATEGSLGFAARTYCRKNNLPYNTSYHTRFPEYLKIHWKIPENIGYAFMRFFHKDSNKILVTSNTMKSEIVKHGFTNDKIVVWSRGVDTEIFHPVPKCEMLATSPIILCVSRASKEKGLDDFCSLKTPGTKILVGDGPYLNTLKSKYPDIIFAGYKQGKSLAHYYANADVFVFPSKSDTFGVVMLESIACGTPVAAFPVTGPLDVISEGVNGAMSDDLEVAVKRALECNRKTVVESSQQWSWESCTKTFVDNLTFF